MVELAAQQRLEAVLRQQHAGILGEHLKSSRIRKPLTASAKWPRASTRCDMVVSRSTTSRVTRADCVEGSRLFGSVQIAARRVRRPGRAGPPA